MLPHAPADMTVLALIGVLIVAILASGKLHSLEIGLADPCTPMMRTTRYEYTNHES
jgi:hypothetical protein